MISRSNGSRPRRCRSQQPRDGRAGRAVALQDAAHGQPLGHRLEHRDAAGYARAAPCRRRRRCRASPATAPPGEHLRDAGRLERELHAAAAGGVADRLDRVDVGGADQVGGAELARPARSREARRLTATIVVAPASRAAMIAQSPTEPGAEHRDRRAGAHPQDVEHGARAGLHAAGQRPGDAQVDVVGDLDRRCGRTTTARVPKDDCPKKWSPTGRPCASVVATEPSGRRQPNFSVAIESQYAERPVRQRRHAPHDGKLRTTLSPGATPADLAARLPHDRRHPRGRATAGSDSGRESRTSRSVWHMPEATISTRTSSGRGPDSSTCSSEERAARLAHDRAGRRWPAVVTGWP